MSAFNRLNVTTVCPNCKKSVAVTIQFKYGDTWQHEYQINENINWGRNDVGEPLKARVIVDGAAEPCPNCGYDRDWNFYIVVENGTITAVRPADGTYSFGDGKTYVVDI